MLGDSVAPVWSDGRLVVRDAIDLLGITVLRDDRLRAEGTTVKSKHALIGFVAVLTMVLEIFRRSAGLARLAAWSVAYLVWVGAGAVFSLALADRYSHHVPRPNRAHPNTALS